MKSASQTISIVLALSTIAFGNPPKTEADFVSQFRTAISSKNAAGIAALTYREGMSEKDLAMAERVTQMMMNNDSEIEDVIVSPLPKDFQTVVIIRGKKVEMTSPPTGVIEIKYKKELTGVQATSTPYAIIDNTYYLVGPKSSDLGWKGPPDKNIGFMVMGQGQSNAKILVQWNASGVPQTLEFSEPSSTFWGQHIDSVTVTSDSVDADLTITILEEGKPIHTTEPLKGKGKLEYKRKS